MKKLPQLSEARRRLDDAVKSETARALGSVRVAWGDLVVLRDALQEFDAMTERHINRKIDPLEKRIMRDPL